MLHTWKKAIAIFTTICLLLGAMGMTAFAEESTNAAKIGDQVYATLDEAIDKAADGDTITLLANCTTEGINLTKNLTIKGSANKETITFTKYGIALWKKALAFESCNVVMNEIGSTPYGEWNWMTISSGSGSSLSLTNATMTMDGKGFDKHAIYFGGDDALNLTSSTLTIRNYKQDALEWDGGNGGYNVNLTDSTFVSDKNRSGFTGTFTAKITNSNVNVTNSLGNGSNGSHFELVDSVVNFTDSVGHGLSAGNLSIHHSTVNANGNGGNGIHVTGKLNIDQKSTVTVQENDCSISSKWTIPGALMIAGQSKISDSTVTIQNNGGSGIYQKSGSLTVEDDAKLTIVKNTAEKLGLGGGVYVNGTMQLADRTVLYNNHAATAGDDIYNLGEITFGEVGSDWSLDGEPDCEHAITGWFDDAADSRWNAHAKEESDLHVVEFDTNGEAMATALKAAHGIITYTVTVNYLDKATGEKIAESFVTEDARENTAYDVSAKDRLEIDGYDYNSTTGDALTGTLTANKIINVYYDEIEFIEDSSTPLDGPTSSAPEKTETSSKVETEEEISDNSVPLAGPQNPATGSQAVLPILFAVVILSGACAAMVVIQKRRSKEQ